MILTYQLKSTYLFNKNDAIYATLINANGDAEYLDDVTAYSSVASMLDVTPTNNPLIKKCNYKFSYDDYYIDSDVTMKNAIGGRSLTMLTNGYLSGVTCYLNEDKNLSLR